MSEKKSDPRDEKMIDIFSQLLDLDLLPQSIDEAEEILRVANINIDEFNKKSLHILREISREFENDWRNVGIEEVLSISNNLDGIPLDLGSGKEVLVQRIQNLIANIGAHNKSSIAKLGLAWRNLDKQSNEDLARVLRKLEFIAKELNIDTKQS